MARAVLLLGLVAASLSACYAPRHGPPLGADRAPLRRDVPPPPPPIDVLRPRP